MFGAAMRFLTTAKGLGGLLVLALALGLALVWTSTERTQLSYELREMDREQAGLEDHLSKLQTEWENKTSSHTLVRLAKSMGLKRAHRGQMRNLALEAAEDRP